MHLIPNSCSNVTLARLQCTWSSSRLLQAFLPRLEAGFSLQMTPLRQHSQKHDSWEAYSMYQPVVYALAGREVWRTFLWSRILTARNLNRLQHCQKSLSCRALPLFRQTSFVYVLGSIPLKSAPTDPYFHASQMCDLFRPYLRFKKQGLLLVSKQALLISSSTHSSCPICSLATAYRAPKIVVLAA